MTKYCHKNCFCKGQVEKKKTRENLKIPLKLWKWQNDPRKIFLNEYITTTTLLIRRIDKIKSYEVVVVGMEKL